MLKVYGRANSINVRKVLWIADEIGIAYEREDWGRGYRPVTEAAFQAINPFSAVPVIDDAGYVLRESNTIVRYLADSRGRRDLYPADLQARYAIDALMDWGATDLYWGVRPVFIGLHLKLPGMDKPDLIAAGIADWTQRMRLLDAHLSHTRAYAAGAAFTIADVPLGLIVNRWFGITFDKPDLPAITDYFARLKQRPAYLAHGANGTP
jgi:glutathione S-transferase